MSEIDRLKSAVTKLLAHASDQDEEITSLKAQLATAEAEETGTPDSVLTTIISEIETVTGPVADPDAATSVSTTTSGSTGSSTSTSSTSTSSATAGSTGATAPLAASGALGG